MCAACTSAIEKALQNLDGVSWVRVNLGGETATAKYDPSKIKLVDIETQAFRIETGRQVGQTVGFLAQLDLDKIAGITGTRG